MLERAPPKRPVWLLGPNVLAACVPFVPVVERLTIVGEWFRDVAKLLRSPRALTWTELLLFTGLLLAVPLAGWTIRLVWRPLVGAVERNVAWCVALVPVALLIVQLAYVTSYCREYVASILFTIPMLLAGLGMTYTAWRRWRGSFGPALIALSVVSASQITFLVCVVLAHHQWTPFLFMFAWIAAIQILAAGVTLRAWGEP